MVDCIWNTTVRKHNLRGSENKMNMIVRELVCISVWWIVYGTLGLENITLGVQKTK